MSTTTTTIIQWSKEYREDLGEEDENGFLEYAYRYFVYQFSLLNSSRITIKRYTDEPDRDNLFLSRAGNKHAGEEFLLEERQFVSAVIAFMQAIEGSIDFYYFHLASGYKLLDTSSLEAEPHDFSFVKMLG